MYLFFAGVMSTGLPAKLTAPNTPAGKGTLLTLSLVYTRLIFCKTRCCGRAGGAIVPAAATADSQHAKSHGALPGVNKHKGTAQVASSVHYHHSRDRY